MPHRLTRRAALAGGLGLVAAGSPRRARGQSAPPDIILFITDDMRESDWEMLGPVRDRIGGTWLPNFRYPTPQCAASRAALLTGQYAHNNGIIENNPGWPALRPNAGRTLFTALETAGYHTGYVGKFMNNYRAGTPVPGLVDNRALTHQPPYRLGGQYTTDLIRDQATAVIAAAPDDQPLFLTVGFNAPHDPALPAARHRTAPVSPSLSNHDRRRRQTLLAVNEAVVAIADALGARWAQAVVAFISDHGFVFPEDGRRNVSGKGFWYPEITRVPALLRAPGLAVGPDARLAATIDIAPTLALAGGAVLDWPVDGRALQEAWTRTALFAAAVTPQRKEIANLPFSALLGVDRTLVQYQLERRQKKRTKRDKRSPARRKGKTVRRTEYYTDPEQRENSWPSLDPAAQDELLGRRRALSACAGETCRTADEIPWP